MAPKWSKIRVFKFFLIWCQMKVDIISLVHLALDLKTKMLSVIEIAGFFNQLS